jgi:predicted ester cyclase
MKTGFPDVRGVIEDVDVDGDRVAKRLVSSGTQIGAYMGMLAIGKKT